MHTASARTYSSIKLVAWEPALYFPQSVDFMTTLFAGRISTLESLSLSKRYSFPAFVHFLVRRMTHSPASKNLAPHEALMQAVQEITPPTPLQRIEAIGAIDRYVNDASFESTFPLLLICLLFWRRDHFRSTTNLLWSKPLLGPSLPISFCCNHN